MDHRSIFNSDARSTADSVAMSGREGMFARATGQSACLNPYLDIAANRDDISDAQYDEWRLCCRAWWKGWDDEELRRRPHQLARHSPGALPWPKVSDLPPERAARLAERSFFRPQRAIDFWAYSA